MATDAISSAATAYQTYTTPGTTSKSDTSKPSAAAAQTDSAEISAAARALAEQEALNEVDTGTPADATYSSKEGKEAEAARFDAKLAELRSQYSEQEAIERFNEFMRSEGYEVREKVQEDTLPQKTATAFLNGKAVQLVGVISIGNSAFSHLLGKPVDTVLRNVRDGRTFMESSSYSSHFNDSVGTAVSLVNRKNMSDSHYTASTVTATMVDGKMQYKEATYAIYNAATNSQYNAVEFWKNRNADKLSEKAGFDVGEYVNNLGNLWGDAFAAESVSTELGTFLQNVLDSAGITLNPDQNLHFFVDMEGDRATGIGVGFGQNDTRIQSALDKAVKDNPSILQAFAKEYASVEQYDLDQLGGFNNGVQSCTFQQNRSFVISGAQPGVAVMGSNLMQRGTGYEYVKKVSDTLDLQADVVEVKAKPYTTAMSQEEHLGVRKLIDEVRDERRAINS